MFKVILLPVDLSDRHGPALNAAIALAGQSGGEVILLHVIEVIPGLSMAEEKEFYRRLEKLARSHLEKLSKVPQQHKVNCRGEILYGNRGPEILRLAVQTRADLIVLTAPRLDPTNPAAGWASLSYKVGMLAPCPVLLVK
jgi:nucleotide-binding universal stress UspA family protein